MAQVFRIILYLAITYRLRPCKAFSLNHGPFRTKLLFSVHHCDIFFKIWAICVLFLFIFVFTLQSTFGLYKISWWQVMNHRPLVSETTARPTELQPLPNNVIFFPSLALTPFVYLHLLDTLALTRRHFFVPDFSESRNYILSHASESLLRKLLSFFFTFMQRRHLCDPPLQGTINIIFSSSNFLLGNRFQAAFA